MTTNPLLLRLKKVGSIKTVETLNESQFFGEQEQISTDIPILNMALSGKVNGGLSAGLTFIAGPSKHFKSLLGLIMVKAYMDKYPDAVCLFFDSEFGITPDYIKSVKIDGDRILHIPIEHVEQLKFDLRKRLEEVNRGDKVIIFIDSIGNLASKKEADDALEEKSVADMSRAKGLKSLWRIITPSLIIKNLPCIAINHTYQEMALYPKNIMGGGTGGMYSANQVLFIGKSQEKVGTDIVGWNFSINIEKSRFVKEKSKFPFLVTYDKGVDKYSGLLDLAIESGHVIKPSNGWYQLVDENSRQPIEPKVREKDTRSDQFLGEVLRDYRFHQFVEQKYIVGTTSMLSDDVIDAEIHGEIEDD